MQLPRVGVWLGLLASEPAGVVRETLAELEGLGYGCFWFAEGGAKEALSHSALLLGWTRNAVVAPGIANIYARDPMAAANGARTLAEAYPGRFVLGLGVSHAPSVTGRGHVYGSPVATMRAYLDAMDAAPYAGPPPPIPPPRVLAALGPQMLKLAGERSWGAHPYFVPVAHTSFARGVLGTGPLLAPEQGFVLESDAGAARAAARRHTARYLSLDNYRRDLIRLGYPEDELAGEGSDRVVDDVVAWGAVESVAERVRAHLDAGADHVCVQALGDDPLDELRRLAPAVTAV